MASCIKRANKMSNLESRWNKLITSQENDDDGSYNTLQNRKQVKRLCKEGIPSSIRGSVWLWLTGARDVKHRNPSVFQQLLNQTPADRSTIEVDLPRVISFPPHHQLFTSQSSKRDDLYTVVSALSVYDTSKFGYTHPIGQLCAMLLSVMSEPEDVFWTLICVVNLYAPIQQPRSLVHYCDIMDELVGRHHPHVLRLLKEGCDSGTQVYVFSWFQCLFVHTLPLETTLWVWDVFLGYVFADGGIGGADSGADGGADGGGGGGGGGGHGGAAAAAAAAEGARMLFRVALALHKLLLPSPRPVDFEVLFSELRPDIGDTRLQLSVVQKAVRKTKLPKKQFIKTYQKDFPKHFQIYEPVN